MSINYGHYPGPQRHSSQYGRPPPPPQHHHHQPSYGGGHYQPPPPPGADPQLWQYFTAVDADRSGSISVGELQQALVNGKRVLMGNDRSDFAHRSQAIGPVRHCSCITPSQTHSTQGFDLDTVKMLMTIFVSASDALWTIWWLIQSSPQDSDRSGSINFTGAVERLCTGVIVPDFQ